MGSAFARGLRPTRWEAVAALAVVALAAFLRLHAVDLAEFKLDEATAVDRARGVLDGSWPTVGLTSSVGALNPPFFVYLTAIPLAVHDDPLAATVFVGVLAVIAIALTSVVLRPRFGPFAALTAAALFATAPCAVLYGRKIWAQDVLPVVCVSLIWCLFRVLEQRRTRAVQLVPVFLCLAFQLNFSALALAVPVAVTLAYRAREVDWRWCAAGVGAAALLLGPWLGHEATHGFVDVGRLLSEGRGSRGSSPIGAGTGEAIRQTMNVLGGWNWGYVAGRSRGAFVDDAGWAWTAGFWASAVAVALLVLGVYACAIRIVAGARRRRGWPWLDLDLPARRRALLLVWLLGIWFSYLASATSRIFPHYLIVSYPVSFAVAAVGLADLAGVVRRRFVAAVGVSVVVAVVTGYAAFSVAFLRFVDREGGTGGDYGVVYHDKLALARAMRQRDLRADDTALELLAYGSLAPPPRKSRFVTVSDTLAGATPRACSGEQRSFGPLVACFPATSTG